MVLWIGVPRDPLIHGVAFSFFAVVAGLLIGAVGVFLGTLGNLYALIARDKDIPIAERSVIIDLISASVREVKHNVLFTIIALAIVVALQFFKPLDIPGVRWPFSSTLFSKIVPRLLWLLESQCRKSLKLTTTMNLMV